MVSVISAPETPVAVSANLKSDAGKTDDRLCNWIELEHVNVLLVPK